MSKADEIMKKHNYEMNEDRLSVTYTYYFNMLGPQEIEVMKNGYCKIDGQLIDGKIIKAIAQKFEEKEWL